MHFRSETEAASSHKEFRRWVGGDRLHKSIDEQRSEYPTLATVMHPRDPYPMEAAY